jgi:ubiquinol-cytochrome c reductase cytochrome b subunit
LIGILAFQVFLNIAAYNAALTGMKNISLFFVGLMLFVFAGFFHLYRYGLSEQKNAPPPPPKPVVDEKPMLAEPQVSAEAASGVEGESASAKPEEKPIAPEIPAPKSQSNLGTGASTGETGELK